MAVLGLTLLKNLSNSSTAIDVSESKRFVGAVLRMFASSHQHGNSGQCEVTPLYQQHWEDIGELWLLGMQCKFVKKVIFFLQNMDVLEFKAYLYHLQTIYFQRCRVCVHLICTTDFKQKSWSSINCLVQGLNLGFICI